MSDGIPELFSIRGRIGRATWWGVTLASWIFTAILDALFIAILDVLPEESEVSLLIALVIALVGAVFILWVSTAAHIKRWHDRNKSGWMVLILLIPVLGALWSLIELGFLRGTKGPNRFGPDPLAPGSPFPEEEFPEWR